MPVIIPLHIDVHGSFQWVLPKYLISTVNWYRLNKNLIQCHDKIYLAPKNFIKSKDEIKPYQQHEEAK